MYSCYHWTCISGAGISTESGIPDYRSEGVGLYARSTNRPIQYQDFVKYADIRQRYWARNYVGWPKFGYFQPNSSHRTLALWEKMGKVYWLVTQNVDALHYKAGSQRVTELHGSAHRWVVVHLNLITTTTKKCKELLTATCILVCTDSRCFPSFVLNHPIKGLWGLNQYFLGFHCTLY